MSGKIINIVIYSVTIISLVIIDSILGNGLKNLVFKFVNKFVIEHLTSNKQKEFPNIKLLLIEILIVIFTTVTFKLLKYLQLKENGDLLDDLLNESNELLTKTNTLLEKFRLLNNIIQDNNNHSGYKLETPVLRMAIFNTQGTHNSERGEAGDANFMDSTILSVSSLLDENIDDTLSDL